MSNKNRKIIETAFLQRLWWIDFYNRHIQMYPERKDEFFGLLLHHYRELKEVEKLATSNNLETILRIKLADTTVQWLERKTA